jgi:hypothetical protein
VRNGQYLRSQKLKTYNPEQPSPHLINRYHISGVERKVREYGHGHTNGRVIIAAEQPDCAEEALHCQECDVVNEVKREKIHPLNEQGGT